MSPAPRYRNPILNADWSDPDAIRVGDHYYMTVSTFSRSPGLPVLRSTDLVTWEIIGHALPRLVPEDHYALPRRGSGVWAPSIRHHDGRFWIFYPAPDHGIYVTTAIDAAGPWSAPRLLLAGRGLIDPCPLWDEDGHAYLVIAWAKTRSGFNNVLSMYEMAPDGSRLLGPGRVIVDGDALDGCSWLEGPKIHRRSDWYYLFAPAGSVPTGWQSVFRSRSVWGPYEERRLLDQGTTDVNGPHQGAWVEGIGGGDWFLHFQDRGPVGRVVHLQPMSWGNDGWPRLGTNAGSLDDGAGEPVDSHPRPPGGTDLGPMPTSDDWSHGVGAQWYWQANAGDGWQRTEGDGTLELPLLGDDLGSLLQLPRVLGQRMPGRPFRATVRVELPAASEGARAGLVLLGLTYCWVGLVAGEGAETQVVAATGGQGQAAIAVTGTSGVDLTTFQAGGQHRQDETLGRARSTGPVEVAIAVDDRLRASTAWRADGDIDWRELSSEYEVSPGFWTGADIGLFATAPIGSTSDRWARFGPFSLELP